MVTLKKGGLRLLAKEQDVEMYLSAGWKIVEETKPEDKKSEEEVADTKPKGNFKIKFNENYE